MPRRCHAATLLLPRVPRAAALALVCSRPRINHRRKCHATAADGGRETTCSAGSPLSPRWSDQAGAAAAPAVRGQARVGAGGDASRWAALAAVRSAIRQSQALMRRPTRCRGRARACSARLTWLVSGRLPAPAARQEGRAGQPAAAAARGRAAQQRPLQVSPARPATPCNYPMAARPEPGAPRNPNGHWRSHDLAPCAPCSLAAAAGRVPNYIARSRLPCSSTLTTLFPSAA